MLEHFRYLKAHTKVTPKMTIPSPSVMHFRLDPNAVDKAAYPDRDAILDDLATTYQQSIKAFYDAGCRYLQFDDTVWAYLCSEDQLRQAAARGSTPRTWPSDTPGVINAALKAKPADMAITTHVCRGNFRSTWISEGGYEPVAEILLGQLNYDGYFLEYDTDRAGGFEPLRFLPKRQQAGGGRPRHLQERHAGEEGRHQAPPRRGLQVRALEQLCLSPQCGFASTEEGNVLTEEQQWAKLAMTVDIAREVWK